MAESTTTRLGLRRWSAGTDTPARSEFDNDNAQLELLAAIDKQDTFASRPAAGVRGTYFWDTTNNLLWRDTGSAWFAVSSTGRDATFKSSTNASVPLTVDTFGSGQTANLFEAKVNGVVKAAIDKDGKYTGGSSASTNAIFSNTNPATAVVVASGAVSQSANLLELKNNAAANQFTVGPTGIIQSTYFRSGTNSTINADSSTTVANQSSFSGTPVLEIRANGTGTFRDFIYLKHAVADGTAATRQLGILMKVGNEDATGASRSGAIYLTSAGIAFDQPSMRIDVRDLTIWDMRPNTNDGSTTGYPVYSSQFFKSTATSTASFRAVNTEIGAQGSGNNMYFRSASSNAGFYWYGGGTHSSTNGSAGSGGTTYASLQPDGTGLGVFTVPRVVVSSAGDVDPSSTEPAFLIGSTSGEWLGIDTNEIAAFNGTVSSALTIQGAHNPASESPTLALGNASTNVRINGVRLAISTNGVAPIGVYNTGDVWIDSRLPSNGGRIFTRFSNAWSELAKI